MFLETKLTKLSLDDFVLFCVKIWRYNFSAFCSKLSLIDNPVILNDLMREFGNKSWWWEFGPNIKLNYFKKNILEKLLFVESQVATSYNSVIIESPWKTIELCIKVSGFFIMTYLFFQVAWVRFVILFFIFKLLI